MWNWGDRSDSFNISTTAAFVLAGGGIKMAKHGRSISLLNLVLRILEALELTLIWSQDLGRVFEKAGVSSCCQNLHPGVPRARAIDL